MCGKAVTERFVVCQVCSGTEGVPHEAHRTCLCAHCGKDLGLVASSKKFADKNWLGFCTDCDLFADQAMKTAAAQRNLELEALDNTELQGHA